MNDDNPEIRQYEGILRTPNPSVLLISIFHLLLSATAPLRLYGKDMTH
jgi:hypothetical protein